MATTNLAGQRDITTPLNLVQTPVPQTSFPGLTLETAPPNFQLPASQAVSSAFSNIIKTGSAAPIKPATTTQTQPQTQPQAPAGIATLINPATGARVAAKDSADAQRLFGQGFVLEQTPGVPVTGAKVSNTTTNNTTNVQQTNQQATSRIPFLRGEANKVRSEAFNTVYGYTPDDWQNLSHESQRRLRNQRVQGLQGQLGNLNSAIQQAQQEEASARTQAQQDKENSLNTLNTYLKYGVLSKLDPAEKQKLAATAGLSANALDTIANQPKETELKTLGADLYQISYGSDGQPTVKLLASGKSGGGGGGGTESGFIPQSKINTINQLLSQSLGNDGYTNTETYRSIYAEVAANFGTKAAKEFLSRFPVSSWLNPQDSTASVFFGTKPSGLKLESNSLDSLIE